MKTQITSFLSRRHDLCLQSVEKSIINKKCNSSSLVGKTKKSISWPSFEKKTNFLQQSTWYRLRLTHFYPLCKLWCQLEWKWPFLWMIFFDHFQPLEHKTQENILLSTPIVIEQQNNLPRSECCARQLPIPLHTRAKLSSLATFHLKRILKHFQPLLIVHTASMLLPWKPSSYALLLSL